MREKSGSRTSAAKCREGEGRSNAYETSPQVLQSNTLATASMIQANSRSPNDFTMSFIASLPCDASGCHCLYGGVARVVPLQQRHFSAIFTVDPDESERIRTGRTVRLDVQREDTREVYSMNYDAEAAGYCFSESKDCLPRS